MHLRRGTLVVIEAGTLCTQELVKLFAMRGVEDRRFTNTLCSHGLVRVIVVDTMNKNKQFFSPKAPWLEMKAAYDYRLLQCG